MFEKALEKIKGKSKEVKEKKETEAKLFKWKEKLEDSLSSHSNFRNKSNEWDIQYHDTEKETDTIAFMSNKGGTNNNEEESNVNITMQLIEGSIDIAVPKPAVSAIESADGMENRKMIEGMLTYMSECANLQKIVSESERITKKNGMSVLKVMYDPDFNGRSYRGRIDTTNPHPMNIIPQKDVSKIEDMDFLFHIENKTIDKICRKYGEQFRSALEDEGAEFGYLETFGDESKNRTDDMVSVVECWYKDQDDDVCLLTWADDTLLRDLPKFYYPRGEDGEIEYMETLEIEEPANVPMMQDGEPQFDGMGEVMQQQVNTIEVERRVPKRFPFVLWYNIPKEKSIYGVSDCQIIKHQQDSIRRMITKEERKQNKGTTKIFVRKDSGLMGKLKDAESQIIEANDPTGDVRVVDIKVPNNGTYELYGLQLQAAKDLVGVTEASQGRADVSNMSGKALEALTANTASRLSIKTNEKYIAFRELYQLYYEFLIAYYDDKVPYRIDGASEVEYGYFDKSKLLKQDVTGEFYYPDFDIYINADAGMAKDKNFMIQIADNAIKTGAADAIDYWTIMDSINMPNASFILERARERQEQQQMAEKQALEEARKDKEYERQNIQGNADAVLKENEELKRQLSKKSTEGNSKEQPQQEVNTDDIAEIIAQLSPEEQEQFFSASEEEKQQMLANMEGGN